MQEIHAELSTVFTGTDDPAFFQKTAWNFFFQFFHLQTGIMIERGNDDFIFQFKLMDQFQRPLLDSRIKENSCFEFNIGDDRKIFEPYKIFTQCRNFHLSVPVAPFTGDIHRFQLLQCIILYKSIDAGSPEQTFIMHDHKFPVF